MLAVPAVPEDKGEFRSDWKLKADNPAFLCRKCGSDNVWYRVWYSVCGDHSDTIYECHNCNRTWCV